MSGPTGPRLEQLATGPGVRSSSGDLSERSESRYWRAPSGPDKVTSRALDETAAATRCVRSMNRIYLSPPDVRGDERALLLDALDSNWLAPLGPHVDAFEAEMCEKVRVPHAVAVSSGTAALHLALLVLGVGRGDDVFVSDLTFAATANAACYVGARPVFIDCDPKTWTMSPDLLAEALGDAARRSRLPKAVIAVDLYGQCADYAAIASVCQKYAVPVVQDAAEALGSEYRGAPAGGQGDLSVLSFNGNKIITASAGGMLLSQQGSWVGRAKMLASQARQPVPHYEHEEVGYNYRLSNVLAALGRAQLRSLSERVELRRRNFQRYQDRLGKLPGWSFMPEAPYGRSNRWLTCATIDETAFGADREQVRRQLERSNIEARPVWKPMHMQPVFSHLPRYGGTESEALFAQGLCLPSGSNLSNEDFERIVTAIEECQR